MGWTPRLIPRNVHPSVSWLGQVVDQSTNSGWGVGGWKERGGAGVCCQRGKGAGGTRGEAASAPPLAASALNFRDEGVFQRILQPNTLFSLA